MDKWEYLKIKSGTNSFTISPYSKVDLDRLFLKYPLIKREIVKDPIYPEPQVFLIADRFDIIEFEILDFLGEQGWEAYAHDVNAYYFKRRLG